MREDIVIIGGGLAGQRGGMAGGKPRGTRDALRNASQRNDTRRTRREIWPSWSARILSGQRIR